ncbi:hypothetical protein QTH90_10265 [Variovorax sp. J2P1-59]|uniref:hypothetical protein n=1 Tax=Variovorax flavidus TaxID=3053501 RepID=UPI002579131E|nr:hypothetical protein [Variovorax sp. J2P1-59]MDM0074767.1 hypothetical protein [Variovorax sp. J2P1-59]
MDRVWRWGYVAICLLAIAAAGVIARGVAHVELKFATVAVDAAPVPQALCAAKADRQPGLPEAACAKQASRTAAVC